jgi:hypothetical protein
MGRIFVIRLEGEMNIKEERYQAHTTMHKSVYIDGKGGFNTREASKGK